MSVLVILEPFEGSWRKPDLSLLSYGNALAGQMGLELHALCGASLQQPLAREAARYGVQKLLLGKNLDTEPLDAIRMGSWLASAAHRQQARVVILGSSPGSRALAPVIAARLNAALVTGVFALPLKTDPFEVQKSIFSGKAIASIRLDSPVKVLTLQANSFEIRENPSESFEVHELEEALPEGQHMELLSREVHQGKVRLTEAEVVVSGGRGMRGPENWAPLEELARLLNAATACSRPVSDEGWRPHSEHVGQTGKIIAPNLYIALGISGAIQHLAGVQASRVILAVNKDPDASIFQAADYGIVGDVQQVLPRLIEAVRKIKQ